MNVSVVHTVATLSERSAARHIRATLEESLEVNVRNVDVNRTRVHVTIGTASPLDSEQASLLKSAAHVIVQEEISRLCDGKERTIVIFVTPMSVTKTNNDRTFDQYVPVTEWIQKEKSELIEFMTCTVEIKLRTFLGHTLNALPWKYANDMRTMLEPIVHRAVVAYSRQQQDPLLSGCVDEILPIPRNFLSELDVQYVEEHLTCLGWRWMTLLEFYEALYQTVTQSQGSKTCCVLFDRVFHDTTVHGTTVHDTTAHDTTVDLSISSFDF